MSKIENFGTYASSRKAIWNCFFFQAGITPSFFNIIELKKPRIVPYYIHNKIMKTEFEYRFTVLEKNIPKISPQFWLATEVLPLKPAADATKVWLA